LKSYKNIRPAITAFLFGSDKSIPLEEKMLLAAILIGFVVSLFGGLINLYFGYSLPTLIIPLVLGILLILLFYQVRFKKKAVKLVFPVFLASLIGVGVIWIFNGGYNGSNSFVMITIFVFAIVTSPNKRFSFIYFFFISLMLFLHAFHYYFPKAVVEFPDAKTRFIDSLITLLCSISFIFLMITFLIKNYRLERVVSEDRRKKLEELNKELEQSNAAKDKLFSIIGHDLKSPFNTILGFSELSLEQLQWGESDKAEKSINLSIASAHQTLNLLENLLSWAKSQSGQIDFKPEHLSIQPIIEGVIQVLETSANLKNISLKYFQSGRTPSVIYADKNMLQTILRNLISNAIKFTKPFGKVDVYLISEPHQVEITVSDNGIGMSEETCNSIFRVETNKPTEGTARETGTGLGLVLCKDFVECHGGTITAESQPGQGSQFVFTLPK